MTPYRWWPISFGFARNTSLRTFDWHGWWLPDGTFGRTIHIGPIKVYVGPRHLRPRSPDPRERERG